MVNCMAAAPAAGAGIGLVLVAAGGGELPALAAERLAALLPGGSAAWPLARPEGTAESDPEAVLGVLAARAGGWLAPLASDPGRWLETGLRWADALGAWRQPTLLVSAPEQAGGGAAAAYTALLEQRGVPLLGLVQWGAPWDAPTRRREGLPWLGARGGATQPTPGSEEEAIERALALALVLRARRLGLSRVATAASGRWPRSPAAADPA
jgi:hypothetical protein